MATAGATTGATHVIPKSYGAIALGGFQSLVGLFHSAGNRDIMVKWLASWTGPEIAGFAKASTFFSDGRLAHAPLNVPMAMKNAFSAMHSCGTLIKALAIGKDALVWEDKSDTERVGTTYKTTSSKVVAFFAHLAAFVRWGSFAICMGICAPSTIINKYFLQSSSEHAKQVGGHFALFNLMKDGGALLSSTLEWVARGLAWKNAAEIADPVAAPTRRYSKEMGWIDVPSKLVGADKAATWEEFKKKSIQLALDFAEKGSDVAAGLIRVCHFKAPPLVPAVLGVISSTIGMVRMFFKNDWRVADLSTL